MYPGRREGSTRAVACSARITDGPSMAAARAPGSRRQRAKGLKREQFDRPELAQSNFLPLSRRVYCLSGPMKKVGRKPLLPNLPCMFAYKIDSIVTFLNYSM